MNFLNTKRTNNAYLFFSSKEKKLLQDAIHSAEMQTSGEIHLHLENRIKKTIVEDAKHIFDKIGMSNTQGKNGVLILLAVKEKQFSVIGDSGINSKVEPNFWQEITENMAYHFKHNDFSGGLANGIQRIGEKLSQYFPYEHTDKNELVNVISYSK